MKFSTSGAPLPSPYCTLSSLHALYTSQLLTIWYHNKDSFCTLHFL